MFQQRPSYSVSISPRRPCAAPSCHQPPRTRLTGAAHAYFFSGPVDTGLSPPPSPDDRMAACARPFPSFFVGQPTACTTSRCLAPLPSMCTDTVLTCCCNMCSLCLLAQVDEQSKPNRPKFVPKSQFRPFSQVQGVCLCVRWQNRASCSRNAKTQRNISPQTVQTADPLMSECEKHIQ